MTPVTLFWLILIVVFGAWFLYFGFWYVFTYSLDYQPIVNTSSTRTIDLSTKCGDEIAYLIWTNKTGFKRSVGFYPNQCGV